MEQVQIPGTTTQIYCDTKTATKRPYVTQSLRRQAFDSLHGLAHPGVKATVKLVTQKFVWPNIKKDCANWARACMPCQRAKITRYNRALIGNFKQPSRRFQHIHIDLIGPLPPSRGFKYCLTCIDRFTRWPEAISVTSITAETIAKHLFEQWIAKYGVPERITTDQGRQFESDLFRRLTQLTGGQHWRTTAYHPEANGMIERFHRQLKTAIKCHETESWAEILPVEIGRAHV